LFGRGNTIGVVGDNRGTIIVGAPGSVIRRRGPAGVRRDDNVIGFVGSNRGTVLVGDRVVTRLPGPGNGVRVEEADGSVSMNYAFGRSSSTALVTGNFIVHGDASEEADDTQALQPLVLVGDYHVGGGRRQHRVTYPDAPAAPEPSAPEGTADDLLCIVCLDRARNTVVDPCGHAYACVTCVRASRPKHCAVCKKKIDKVIRKYE
jgi:hypothetical protein